MRTTVTLNDALYEEAKVAAARQGTSVGSVIEDALAEYLARAREASDAEVRPLPVFHGAWARPGFDFDDMSSVWAQLDDDRDVDAVR